MLSPDDMKDLVSATAVLVLALAISSTEAIGHKGWKKFQGFDVSKIFHIYDRNFFMKMFEKQFFFSKIYKMVGIKTR